LLALKNKGFGGLIRATDERRGWPALDRASSGMPMGKILEVAAPGTRGTNDSAGLSPVPFRRPATPEEHRPQRGRKERKGEKAKLWFQVSCGRYVFGRETARRKLQGQVAENPTGTINRACRFHLGKGAKWTDGLADDFFTQFKSSKLRGLIAPAGSQSSNDMEPFTARESFGGKTLANI